MHPTTQALIDSIRGERVSTPQPGAMIARLQALDAWCDAGFPDASQPKNGPHVAAVGLYGAAIEVWQNGKLVSAPRLEARYFGRYIVVIELWSDGVLQRNLRVIRGQAGMGGDPESWLDPETGTTRPTIAEWLVHPSTLELL